MAGKGAKKRARARAKAVAQQAAQARRAPVKPVDPSIQQKADTRFSVLQPQRAAEEERLKALRELHESEYGHKRNGTPATYANAEQQTRAGGIARLYHSGALSDDQLAWAVEISAEHERIDADVSIRGVKWDTRVDIGIGDSAAQEHLWAVWRAVAYTRWRAALPGLLGKKSTGAHHILAMVVDDLGVTWAARHLQMSVRRVRGILEKALNLWPDMMRDVCRSISEADLAYMDRALA